MTKTFFHSGDIGDIIACLPAIRQLGGGHLWIGDTVINSRARESMKGARYEALKPLLKAQEYIASVTWIEERIHPDDKRIDHNFSNFRYGTPTCPFQNLAERQADFIGVYDLDQSPWLKVSPSHDSKNKFVIARSPRYHTSTFPWAKILEQVGDRGLFVGHSEEHDAFRQKFNTNIPFYSTSNLLELASIISGSVQFIGNQSAPMWVAMGLGHPLIQETLMYEANSMVPRSNAQYFKCQ